ncbi:MAG: peptidoglycan-associated lipoprotein Pal [Oligoflexia bacterium]|nr:peptidoglycan-associated lipoprotein Pal [Oligoflexia bacterium]
MKKFIVVLAGLALFAGCSKKGAVDSSVEKDAPAVASEYGSGGSDHGQAGDLVTVNFDYDKSVLTESAKSRLKKNAEWLKQNAGVFIQIEGHCDNRGTIEYNLALGEKRALTVQGYLLKLGIEKKRLSTISYGEERPLSFDDNEMGWAKNRRANFVIVSK